MKIATFNCNSIRKRMPIVLFGSKYWDEVINFDALVKYGTISPGDLDLFHRTDSVDEAYEIITKGLTENALGIPGLTNPDPAEWGIPSVGFATGTPGTAGLGTGPTANISVEMVGPSTATALSRPTSRRAALIAWSLLPAESSNVSLILRPPSTPALLT